MVYLLSGIRITGNNIPPPPSPGVCPRVLLAHRSSSKHDHVNLAALFRVPLVSMDSYVQDMLGGEGCFSINLLSPRAQQCKKQHLASQHKKDKDILERVQQWATMMIKEWSICRTREG